MGVLYADERWYGSFSRVYRGGRWPSTSPIAFEVCREIGSCSSAGGVKASKAVVAACLGVGWINWIGVWVPDLVDSGRWSCRWNGCGCIVMLLLRSGVCAMLTDKESLGAVAGASQRMPQEEIPASNRTRDSEFLYMSVTSKFKETRDLFGYSGGWVSLVSVNEAVV